MMQPYYELSKDFPMMLFPPRPGIYMYNDSNTGENIGSGARWVPWINLGIKILQTRKNSYGKRPSNSKKGYFVN